MYGIFLTHSEMPIPAAIRDSERGQVMSKIVFFSIAAHGHTNPTIEIVRALTHRGHSVRYYSYEMFRERIEAAGAVFIPCDTYMPPVMKNLERRVKYDFSGLIEMVTNVTISMEDKVCAELQDFQPDCIVADSMCIWGKLYAKKLNIPYICSTTTFAFNADTAGMMKPKAWELFYMLMGIRRINRNMKLLREHGYEVAKIVDLIQNDNETNTIVYTSRVFQPKSETFGETYAFIGPSIPQMERRSSQKERPLIYISLGTVIKNAKFFQNCLEALRDCPYDVIMSVGDEKIVRLLRNIPDHFQVKASVVQLEVLQNTDVFITHCGMNSVNESILFEVPMVMAPQHSEQSVVAQRAQEVGAGVILKKSAPDAIKAAVAGMIEHQEEYRKQIKIVAESFRAAGGPRKAADWIELLL